MRTATACGHRKAQPASQYPILALLLRRTHSWHEQETAGVKAAADECLCNDNGKAARRVRRRALVPTCHSRCQFLAAACSCHTSLRGVLLALLRRLA